MAMPFLFFLTGRTELLPLLPVLLYMALRALVAARSFAKLSGKAMNVTERHGNFADVILFFCSKFRNCFLVRWNLLHLLL
jgi:hypothetical protein